MELPITHPAFRTKRLVVETAGFFRGARLLVNGAPAQRTKGKYTVKSDSGADVSFRRTCVQYPQYLQTDRGNLEYFYAEQVATMRKGPQAK